MTIKNASVLPKVYYGLHMVEGVAEYKDPNVNDGQPYRIFINENTIKQMDSTFTGRPVYVEHVDEVDVAKIHEADGYVVESFYNKADGKHWTKFIVVSDRGHEAVRSGWKLSNAYLPKSFASGGLWHGVEYIKEVTNAEYEHLAIVKNPRYQESVIFTPEQFKAYNEQKELELKKLANSKDNKTKGEPSMLKFFKREKVENSTDLENMSVVLPKSGKEFTITSLINEMDKIQNMHGYANGDHLVKVGEDEMSVNEMVEKYQQMCKKNEEDELKKKENEGKEEEKKENEDPAKEEDKKENEEAKAAEEAKKNEEEKKADEKKQNDLNDYFGALKNAPFQAIKNEPSVDLASDKVARGQSRYGSGK